MQRDRVSAGTDPATPAAVPLADYTSPPLRPPDCLHNAYGLKKSRPAKFGLCAWPEPVRPRAHPRGRTRARPCAAAPARPCAAAGTRAHNAHARGRPCAGAGTRPCAAARTRTRALACLRARACARGTVPAPLLDCPGNQTGLAPSPSPWRRALALARLATMLAPPCHRQTVRPRMARRRQWAQAGGAPGAPIRRWLVARASESSCAPPQLRWRGGAVALRRPGRHSSRVMLMGRGLTGRRGEGARAKSTPGPAGAPYSGFMPWRPSP